MCRLVSCQKSNKPPRKFSATAIWKKPSQAKTADTALTPTKEEELKPQQYFKDCRLRNTGLDREVAELREMLEKWKDLIPASNTVAPRWRHGTLR